jgi:hypothetical protein
VPTAMTFTSLQSTLRKYIERGSVSDDMVYEMLPELINIAERNIAIDLNVTGIREVVTAAMVSGTSIYQLPTGWRRTVAINFGGGTGLDQRTGLFPRSYEYCRSYWPDDTQTGTPKFYAKYSDEYMLISPTPDAAYPFELIYYAKPTLLDDNNQTNWITENWPQLLLYATLREVAPFMKEDQRMQTWDAMYSKLLGSITGDDLKKIVDRSSTRQEA